MSYISAFIRTTDRSAVSELEALGVEIQCEFLDGKLFTALIPVDMIGKISDIAKVTRISVATKKIAFTNTAREKTNVDDVLVFSTDARNSGLPNAYDGSGVVMGVIDTGIDFNHVAFKDASGNSRIKQAYVYNGSTERTYTGSQITSSLTDDNSEDHGTHTSSTAGGSSVIVNGTTVTVTNNHANATYGGMAPGSDLYLAGINGLNDTYLANAFQNICNYADQNNQPVVVSNSWGSQMGPHDGTGEFADICAQYFSDSNPNHICLFAASNDAGGNGFHVRGTASSSSPLGSVVSPYNVSGYNLYLGIFANAWTRSTGSTLSCRVHVINSSGSIVKSVDVNPNSGSYTTVNIGSTYIYSGSLIAYRDYVDSEKSQIVLRGYGDSYGIGGLLLRSGYRLAVQFYPSNGSSEIDIWGGSSYNSFVNTPSVSGYTWTAGTDDGCYSDEATIPTAISIGAYASKNGGSNTSYTIGDIADFSSWGTAANSPTGEFYPWITAPGARLIAGVNHNHTSGDYSYYDGVSADMVVNSSTNPYAYMEGTSMATPTAAGIVALWLQVAKDNNIELTTSDIKTIMKETAITDSYTNGTNASHFGNGKIDALAGIKYILDNYVQNDNPTITATPTSIDFGNVTAGTTTTQTFTVTGENLEGNISLSKSGNNYTIDKTSISKNSDGSASATVTVTFAPTANVSQTYTGIVTLTSSNASSVTVSLTGKGVYTAPAITANPTSLSFTGNSGTTYTKTVTVTGTNLQGNITAAISSDANGFYSVSPTTINNSNGSASRTVTVTWAPTAGGTSTANLVLTTTGTGASSVTVPITGTAQAATPTLVVDKSSLTYDTQLSESSSQTITVGGRFLSENVTVTLTDVNNVFSVDKSSLDYATLNNDGTLTVTVTFNSANEGTFIGTLNLTSGSTSQQVALTGTANDTPSYIYVLTTTLTAGKEYLIVSDNSAGSAYAMGHSNTTVATNAVTIKSDASVADAPYIESDYVDATSVWTAGTSGSLWTFKNGSYYATVSSSGGNRSLTFATSSSNNWTQGTNQLYYKGQRNSYYLRYYNNSFSIINSSAYNIYLYEKTQVVRTRSLTLAELEGSGTTGTTYTISDQLIAVDYAQVGDGNDVYLWCKDQGNASIAATEKRDDQTDFMRDESINIGGDGTHNGQDGEWDQSNWVVLKLTGSDALSKASAAVSGTDKTMHYIEPGTITGKYVDDTNFILEVSKANFTVGEVADYPLNVYCAANFIDSNLNTQGNTGAVGKNGTKYFFMNPKIQEVCEITYAMWYGSNTFVVPTSTDIDGAFNVDFGYNEYSTPTLNDESVYRFRAVVSHPVTLSVLKAAGETSSNYIVYPMNLAGGNTNVITAINGVYIDGSREVIGVDYVNVAGLTSDKPFQGVNIVVTRYRDGSRSTVKKVFK